MRGEMGARGDGDRQASSPRVGERRRSGERLDLWVDSAAPPLLSSAAAAGDAGAAAVVGADDGGEEKRGGGGPVTLSGTAAETRREGRRRTRSAGSVQDPPVSRRRPTQPPSARVVYGEGHDPFRILGPILDHRLGHVYSPALSRADPIQTRSCVFSARKKFVNAGP